MKLHDCLTRLKIKEFDAGEVFSNKPSGTMVKGYDRPSEYTPVIEADYIFQEASRDIIVWLLNPGDPLYVFGPCGSGKTSHIKQLAARLNYPVFEVTAHGRLEFADLAGHLSVQDGNMIFQYGPLALAMTYGGICLVNEIDLASPEVAAGLNGVLDGSPLCIAENGGELKQIDFDFCKVKALVPPLNGQINCPCAYTAAVCYRSQQSIFNVKML